MPPTSRASKWLRSSLDSSCSKTRPAGKVRLLLLQSPPATAVLPGGGQSQPPSQDRLGSTRMQFPLGGGTSNPAPAAEKPKDPWAPPSVGKMPATFSSFAPGTFCGALSAWLLFTHRHLGMVPETSHPELDADLQPWLLPSTQEGREAPLGVKHERPNGKLVGGWGTVSA